MKKYILLLFILTTLKSISQDLVGLSLGDTYKKILPMLKEKSAEVEIYDDKIKLLPIAKENTIHVVSRKFKVSEKLTIDKIIFTFTDDRLNLVQSLDSRFVRFVQDNSSSSEAVPYAGYTVYPKTGFVISNKNSSVSWLQPQHLHSHIFLWTNPLLINSSIADDPVDFKILNGVELGMSIEKVKQIMKPLAYIEEKPIKPSRYPIAKEDFQLNSYGYSYGGFPRKIEFIFLDGELKVIWILTAKEEEGRIKASFSRQFGNPIRESKKYIYFNRNMRIRKDVSEILITTLKDHYLP